MTQQEYPNRDPQMFYELARDRHATRAASLQALDNKLSFFLSSSSALIGILVAVYALRPNAFHVLGLTFLSISIAAWALLTIAVLTAYKPRPLKSGPKLPNVFALHFGEDSDARLKWRVANTFWHDYNNNKKHEDQKALALSVALGLFVTQTVLLLATLLVVAVAPSHAQIHHSECPGRAGHAEQGPARTGRARPPQDRALRVPADPRPRRCGP
jgi:hypothetical protein